ncbi:Uu.00g054860.m01.CDS01 [Anthostomella pinea]|uniref:Uu.00g054860.m01.CDS01 n=1 Tax=Anthostomella pinea TaxID=933095 RepID=A0AAI8YPS8_9PEZI|nr:Uu.00g054860.m01.CDS01 [Anthostomella pinea]
MSGQQQQEQAGPPYASRTAGLGGLPSVLPDVPVCAVFMLLYAAFAATNMTILQVNLRRKHKFLLSGLLFGFCMARITTLAVRIGWATHQHNVRLAIAANIFVNVGILIVYIINLIFAQRMLRAKQPRLGWHPSISIALKVLYGGIAAALVCLITSAILGSYTLDAHTLQQCRDIQLTAITYLLVFTTMPLWLLLLAHVLLPRDADQELFGHGSMRSKLIILVLSSCTSVLIAGFKAGAIWSPPRPATDPAWYHSKAAFYVFNFSLEVLVLGLLTLSRIDKRFHIPNGSKGPGDYSGRNQDTTGDKEVPSDGSSHQV